MKSSAVVMICRMLVATMLFMSLHPAQAGMIGVDQVVSAAGSQADRDAVLSALGRSEVASQFQSLGLDPQLAKDRVAAMTDEEVRTLAGKLETLPAGAIGVWGWALVFIILAVGGIYYFGYK